MQPDAAGIAGIAHVIQLAVAPVFLLAGVGATLNVLASRLARVVDRARPMEDRLLTAEPAVAAQLRRHLKVLALRARLINRALTLSVLCALFVALVVVALFLGAVFDLDFSVPIAALFMAGMLSLAVGLLYFLREVFLATATLRIGAPP
jgi:Protein of unknown function (DUF2721)